MKLKREHMWAILAFSIAIALAYVLISIAREDVQGQERREQLYQGIPLDQHLVEVDKKALEAAYQDHLKLLWSVWLKDGVTTVDRINKGLRNAREAYAQAAAKIAEREKALGK